MSRIEKIREQLTGVQDRFNSIKDEIHFFQLSNIEIPPDIPAKYIPSADLPYQFELSVKSLEKTLVDIKYAKIVSPLYQRGVGISTFCLNEGISLRTETPSDLDKDIVLDIHDDIYQYLVNMENNLSKESSKAESTFFCSKQSVFQFKTCKPVYSSMNKMLTRISKIISSNRKI